jgi:ribose 5-phosphate isomerase B
MPERIAVAADHAGYELKSLLIAELRALGLEVRDLGTNGPDSVDYPDFANAVARAIASGEAQRGLLICGTGIGMSIAANRHPAIRCAVAHDVTSARLSRAHNDANVLALGARMIGQAVALDCLHAFIGTGFDGGRHAPRVAKLGKLGKVAA